MTTPELKNNFISAIQQLSQELPQNNIININDYRRTQNIEVQSEMPKEYSINEYGEIIRPNGIETNVEFDDNIPTFTPPTEERKTQQPVENGIKQTRFGAVIDPSRYADQLRPIANQNENKLSLKQRVAQFLQKNNLFMNLSFVDKFVHQQLDVLPEPMQEIKESRNSTREQFINTLTNNGKYRNLPPVQRMSDPERIAQMQRKMEQNQQLNDDNERG